MENQIIVPQHVSIIMDGNGRWARAHGRERVYGHMNGVESVRAAVRAAGRAGVKYLSLYAFSEENWNRPDEEVSTLMNLMMKAIENEYASLMENKVRFVVRGNIGRLSGPLRGAIDALMEKTAGNDALTLIVFLSYSGRWDILQAAKALAREAAASPEKAAALENLSQEDFGKYLVTGDIPDPDLIIRTSGEQRISNYLLWQGAYAELYFTPILWPDFREKDFEDALRAFSSRDRRYGKVKP